MRTGYYFHIKASQHRHNYFRRAPHPQVDQQPNAARTRARPVSKMPMKKSGEVHEPDDFTPQCARYARARHDQKSVYNLF